MYRIFMNENGMDGEVTSERDFDRKIVEIREAGDTTEVYVELTQEEEAQIGADGFDLADILEDESRWVKVLDKWYAVQMDRTDDWGTGSFDYDKAVKMAQEMGAELIAVISGDYCIDEISAEDF